MPTATFHRPATPETLRPGPALPPDLLVEAARRLALFSILGIGFSTLRTAVALVIPGLQVGPAWMTLTLSGVFCAFSFLVYRLASGHRLPLERIPDLATVYALVVGAGFGFATNTNPLPEGTLPPSWSPLAVWIIVNPLVVPVTPDRTLWVSLALAFFDPLGMHLAALAGFVPEPTAAQVVQRTAMSFIACVPATLISQMLYQYSRKLSDAREVGAYHLTERLGQGAMGEVWRATHRMLARQAAVKFIRVAGPAAAGLSLEAIRQRFEREARATAALRSPHTINVFDYGQTPDGGFYYVMELLDGMNLSALVKRFGPVPPERAVFLLVQACHSLHEAHVQGLVHRDIKPANIMACQYGADADFVKVVDFGLVSLGDTGRPDTPHLTAEHVVVGTPGYIAPEAVLDKANLSGSADIYALGCVAYWLLTGQTVFKAPDPTALLTRHLMDQPKAPSAVMPGAGIPPELDAVVLACLAKEVGERPHTARELADKLSVIKFSQSWNQDRAAAWWREHGGKGK